ncbi:MAG: hypothetical protein AAB837_02560 [Patescibacteria group bacterium]
MKNDEIKKLALSLAQADTEKEVVNILKKSGFWNDGSVWHEYGNDPMNYSTIGNQQSSPDNALVEKLVNSVDAVLTRECLRRGIKPDSKDAPQSIAEAQKKFFDIYNGKLSSIDERQRTSLAENILLVATGGKIKPSFSIIDKGEGQTPNGMPETLLSLTKRNKIKIPFVQGKFGMGGSGVLRFCSSEYKLLLVISKRDIQIQDNDETKELWGVTVARREDPKEGEKSSHYTYLAPNDKILSFSADKLALLPGPYPKVFGNFLESGTYIKLYEYEIGSNLRSFIGFDLYYRLALLMPDIALPIRMFERRDYRAHSHDKTLAGLSVRLDEDKSENLEIEFQTPSTGEMTVEGQKLDYSIYVFKKGKKENYATSEGVVFSINGQTHGFLPKTFFDRNAVGMSYLSDSILITINCTKISRRKQEELFMPSRDRLAETPFRFSIEKEMEDIIKNHSGLKDLQNRRRKEAIEDRLQDSKPLADVLEKIIKKSPTLSNLFLRGIRIKNPFNTEGVTKQEEFKGREFPTYFKPVKSYTNDTPKSCPINHKFRIQYETNAENNYFNRDKDPGELVLKLGGEAIKDYSMNLWNGLATLTISIPENTKAGDILCFDTKVSDINQINPFAGQFCIQITKEQVTNGSKNGHRKNPPGDKKGNDRQRESYLDVPNVVDIKREDWNKEDYKEFNFNEYSALKVRNAGEGNGYDFFINIDNSFLRTEMKGDSKTDPVILEARYRYGMVLLGISILDFENNQQKNNKNKVEPNNGISIYDQISFLTEAISPTLLPMIASLGSSEFEI